MHGCSCMVAGGCVWLPGGVHGCRGASMVAGGVCGCREHAWLPGGVHGCRGCVHGCQ